MQIANSRNSSIRKCAFCRNWYDPTNSAIRPKAPAAGFWEFDEHASNMCILKNIDKPGFASCPKFECKI